MLKLKHKKFREVCYGRKKYCITSSEMTPEEMLSSLPYSLYVFDEQTRSKYLMDSDIWWNDKDDDGSFGETVIDSPDAEAVIREDKRGSDGGEAELKAEWQGRAATAATSMSSVGNGSMGCGDVPGFVKRIIERMKKPVVDWKKILNDFVQEQIYDYSFTPPDRRFSDMDFFLPELNEKDFVTKEVLFMADTSGSVADEDLAIVYSEICGAIEQFGGKLIGKLGFFDVKVTRPLAFENVGDLMSIVPYGGGGTDFTVVFDYIRTHCKGELPACIVIFTDGNGPYPPQSDSMGIPVLWIINNHEITPPWGKVARIVPQTAVL